MNTRTLRKAGYFGLLAAVISCDELQAQSMKFISRNGSTTAYCGVPSAGPIELHRFSEVNPTADNASVVDPGGLDYSSSRAKASLGVVFSENMFRLDADGEAERGALLGRGVYAVGDSRDDWRFTLDKPARFKLVASLGADSSEVGGATAGFSFTPFSSGSIIPDPGIPAGSLGGSTIAPAQLERNVRGRILPGTYELAFNARADGVKSPFHGSFQVMISLEISADVPFIHSTRVLDGGLELKWTDLGGKKYVVQTSESLTSDSWAAAAGVAWPTMQTEAVIPISNVTTRFYRVTMED